jgi:hypothetical protein
MSVLSNFRVYPTPPVLCSIPIDHRDKILRDLLKKKPEGPIGDLSLYQSVGYQRERLYYGYRYDIFFRMGVRSEEDLWEVIREIMYPDRVTEDLTRNQRGAVTRSRNKLWPTLKSAIVDTRIVGAQGIYEVYDYSYCYSLSRGILGYVYANDVKTARLLAKTLFGFMTSEKTVRAKYAEWGDKSLVNMLNVAIISRIAQESDQMQEKIVALKEKIQSATCQIDLLTSIMDYD